MLSPPLTLNVRYTRATIKLIHIGNNDAMKGNRERRARELCEKNNNNTQLLARVCENYEYMRMADQSNQKKRKRRKKYSAKYSSGSKEIEMYEACEGWK